MKFIDKIKKDKEIIYELLTPQELLKESQNECDNSEL